MNSPTPAETEQRLGELAELVRFSASLLEARAPLLSDADLTRRSLSVRGCTPAGLRELTFEAGPSSRQHFVGEEYSCWFPLGHPSEATPVRAILVAVVTEDGTRADWLPPRTRGLVTLQFPEAQPGLLPHEVGFGDLALLRLRKPA